MQSVWAPGHSSCENSEELRRTCCYEARLTSQYMYLNRKRGAGRTRFPTKVKGAGPEDLLDALSEGVALKSTAE